MRSLRFSRLCGVLLVNRRPAFCDTREHRRDAKNAEGRIVSFGSGRQAALGRRLGESRRIFRSARSATNRRIFPVKGCLTKRRRTTMQTRRMAGLSGRQASKAASSIAPGAAETAEQGSRSSSNVELNSVGGRSRRHAHDAQVGIVAGSGWVARVVGRGFIHGGSRREVHGRASPGSGGPAGQAARWSCRIHARQARRCRPAEARGAAGSARGQAASRCSARRRRRASRRKTPARNQSQPRKANPATKNNQPRQFGWIRTGPARSPGAPSVPPRWGDGSSIWRSWRPIPSRSTSPRRPAGCSRPPTTARRSRRSSNKRIRSPSATSASPIPIRTSSGWERASTTCAIPRPGATESTSPRIAAERGRTWD